MIVYSNTKGGFVDDVRNGIIAKKIIEEFNKHNVKHHNDAEYRAWSNSLVHMRNALDDIEISDECSVAIKYQIPLTAKRVDFLIGGIDENNNNNIVVIELKQWENSSITSRPDIVTAFTGGANRAVCHPSYQAYSYAKIIENFNEDIYINNISLIPCAFLHNYKEENRSNIDNDFYAEAISYTPIFLAEDVSKLRNFIKKYIKKKDGSIIIINIDELNLLKEYGIILSKLLNYKWAQLLEKFNFCPKIANKVNGISEAKLSRNSLSKYKEELLKEFKNGKIIDFYSGEELEPDNISIDYVIPWSFMYSDYIWNLVVTSKSNNSSKSNSIPSIEVINKLKIRNEKLLSILDGKYKDDLKLSIDNDYLEKFYYECRL